MFQIEHEISSHLMQIMSFRQELCAIDCMINQDLLDEVTQLNAVHCLV
jgi:hypothetical protein